MSNLTIVFEQCRFIISNPHLCRFIEYYVNYLGRIMMIIYERVKVKNSKKLNSIFISISFKPLKHYILNYFKLLQFLYRRILFCADA